MFELVGTIIAGIGLFLTGVRIVSNNMKKMTSRKLRLMIARLTQSKIKSALWGVLAGGISQSGTSSAFLLVSLVSGGLMNAQNALLILTWVEVGTAILVFIATVQMKIAVLYLLAISGVFFSLDKKGKSRSFIGVFFGISLLLYGFDLIKGSSVFLAQSIWVQKLMEQTESSFFLPFLFGAVLRLITQSSSTVSILAMPMAFAGLLNLPQCLMMIYGTSVGSGMANFFLSADIKGTPKQISLFKTIFDVLGAAVMVLLFYAEQFYKIPLINSLIVSITNSVKEQIAFGFLAAKLIPTLVSLITIKPVWKLIVKLSPVSVEESLSKPKYLQDSVLDDAETALDLIKKENERIILRLPEYLSCVRKEDESDDKIDIEIKHKAGKALLLEIENFTKELFQQNISYETAERLLSVQNNHHNIIALEDSVYNLVNSIKRAGNYQQLDNLNHNVAEGVHTILSAFAESIESSSKEDKELLVSLTNDRSRLMERIRKEYFLNENFANQELVNNLLQVTDLYQRSVWLVNRLVSE